MKSDNSTHLVERYCFAIVFIAIFTALPMLIERQEASAGHNTQETKANKPSMELDGI